MNQQLLQVVFDTDPGIDDAIALWLLARHPAFRLRAMTTVFGNASVARTTRNALGLCSLYGLQIPVAAGAPMALAAGAPGAYPADVHGEDGLGGMADVAPPASGLLDSRPAHQLICDMVNAEPGTITLIAVGPLTNLALALRHDPSVAAKVRQVIVMGGAFGMAGHFGNETPVAEANVLNDPEAADEVVTANWPVVVVGLDVTQQVVMDEARLAALRLQGDTGEFLWRATRQYQDFYLKVAGIRGIYAHDVCAAVCALDPAAFFLRPGPVRVACDGIARGQTIQDFRRQGHPGGHTGRAAWVGRPSQQVCVGIDAKRVLEVFDKTFQS